MATFKDKLSIEYPVPLVASCWGSEAGRPALADLDVLIEVCVDDLASDVHISSSIMAHGIETVMPEGTITCTSAMLSSAFPFQGNRLVKVTFDASSRKAYLRYFPAVINYTRALSVGDLDNLSGDRLVYVKSYILWKMAEKELSILKSVNMQLDNASLDFTVLSEFRDKMYQRYTELKSEILMYATVN